MNATTVPLRCLGAVLLLLLGATGTSPADDEKKVIKSWNFRSSGKAKVHCGCVAAVSGCSSQLMWSLQGSAKHSWWQDIHAQEDQSVDLSEACFRKRDVNKMGDGLCCQPDDRAGNHDREQVAKWFGAWEIREP